MNTQSAYASTFDSDTIISLNCRGNIDINEGFGHGTGYDVFETAADIRFNDDFGIELEVTASAAAAAATPLKPQSTPVVLD